VILTIRPASRISVDVGFLGDGARFFGRRHGGSRGGGNDVQGDAVTGKRQKGGKRQELRLEKFHTLTVVGGERENATAPQGPI
jgi:hypothetical protein